MKRISLIAVALALAAVPLAADAKEKLTYAYLQDPVLEAVMWPLRNGKVTSDKLEIDGKGYQIPVLIQGTATKQWDVVMTAVMSVPRAKEQGLELRVLSTALRYHKSGDGAHVWVKKGSPIKSIADLKGKTIATYGLQSTGVTLVRLALWKKYGVNVQFENGDFKWQQLPAPALPGALSTALRYHKSGDGAHVWVRKGSPYKTIADLKGKTIATYGLQSTGVTLVRLALWKKYGVNVQFENGDFKWQQLPAPALPGALATDKVEGATLIHSQAYQASKSGDFVPVAKTAEDMFELFKLRMVSAVNVGYVEKIAAKPELYKEFNRMQKASVTYTLANIGEVSEAVGKETRNDPAYFKAWFEQYSDFPAAVSQNDIDAMNKVWALSKELGVLKDFPDAKTMIWEGAIRE